MLPYSEFFNLLPKVEKMVFLHVVEWTVRDIRLLEVEFSGGLGIGLSART